MGSRIGQYALRLLRSRRGGWYMTGNGSDDPKQIEPFYGQSEVQFARGGVGAAPRRLRSAWPA